MPLTAKGEKIRSAMEKEYGAEKGEEVFYASRNKGTISGVDAFNAVADMTNEDWSELRRTLTKFIGEEEKEPEHREDATAKIDAKRVDAEGRAKMKIELSGREEHLAQVARALRAMEFLGTVGASRTIELHVDGDGAGQVKVKFFDLKEVPAPSDDDLDKNVLSFGIN